MSEPLLCPSSRLISLVFNCALLILIAPSLAADAVQAEIRLQAKQTEPVWVGQELELSLDLLSTGLSFSAQQFSLPQISGAYLLQADSSTIKLNENRAGVAWQGLRYTFLLYPQRPGVIEIPPFGVRFAVSAAYGSEADKFRFTTSALNIQTTLPPGADPHALLVTTTDFQLSASWKPAPSGPDLLQLKTGDALQLSIRRTAADVPAMVFSPLPEFAIEGLRAYGSAPEVQDTINRGELAGSRIDSLTFVCEQTGSYQIPDILFQWWDPERQLMNEETVSGISFEVVPNPVFDEPDMSGPDQARWGLSWWQVLLAVPLLALFLIGGRWCAKVMRHGLNKRREKTESTEAWAFRQVEKFCRAGKAADAYRAINLWLTRLEPRPGVRTLLQLAQQSTVRELQAESERLQSVVIKGPDGDWQGRKLGELLGVVRRDHQQQAVDGQQLPPLNPL